MTGVADDNCNSEPAKTAFTRGEIPSIVALHLTRLLNAY